MSRRRLGGLPVACLIAATGCNSPIAPDPAPEVHVTGQVLAYHRPTEFSTISGAHLYGWVEANGSSGPTGLIALDARGRFDLLVERGARVRLYAGGTTGNEIYQPCAVTVMADRDVHRDVRVVWDYSLIGAAVPPAFLDQTRILSGVVYENVPGGRQPVRFATVTVGGYREWENERGWPIANTRTDNDGRYIICGLEGDANANVYVFKNSIRDVTESFVGLTGDTVLDIDLNTETSPPAVLSRRRD